MVHPFADAISVLFTAERARLLHVVVPAHVHGHTLALLRALGDGGPAPRPVWVLAAPYYGPSRGWPARVRELERERPHGAVPSHAEALPAGGAEASGFMADPRDAFARDLAARAPAGLIVVLAPQHIDDPGAYAFDVEALVRQPGLSTVRWVVVDPAHSALGNLVERLGAGATRVVWPEVDPADWGALEQLLTDLAARGVRLPAEIDARVAPDSPLRAPGALAVRRLLHEADKCGAAGRHADAARLQAEAEAALAEKGLLDEAVHVAMARARTLLAAGAAEEGQRAFVEALREAERLGMISIVPEGYGSLGSLHSKHRRFLESCEAYSRAGQLAERRGSHTFAADMHRCAGHAALNADLPDEAIEAWGRAFALLASSPPVVGALDKPQQLVVIGVTLADAFEAHGNLAAARGLRGHAEAIERQNPRPGASFS
jgi:hypothetical protein